MKSKFLFPSLAVVFLVIMGLFFLINPSYEKSIQAKYYYNTRNYKEAYKLANEAFSADVYNRMAATIMAQSKTSMKYQKYIQQAKKYMQKINVIASQDSISDADKARMKLMSEIMTDSYVKLAPSVITDKDLVAEAAKYHDDFEKLLEQFNR